MHSRIAAAAAIFMVSCAIALPANAAEHRTQPSGGLEGTAKEHSACTGDATKFCVDVMPDTGAVLACLQKHRSKLHKACRDVLESHGV